MIHEIRTYDLKPGSLGQFMERFGEKIERRVEFSPLVGFFYTEIGPLNRVVHIWEYEDEAARVEVREKAAADGNWPPDTSEFIVNVQADVFTPAPFLPKLDIKRNIGPLFELRIYTYADGDIPKVIDAWGPAIEARMELSQPVGIWSLQEGDRNVWVHMWAYESYEHRTEGRKKFASIGWPPPSGQRPITMENMLLNAAPFSPVQ